LGLFGLPPSAANRKNGMVQFEVAEPCLSGIGVHDEITGNRFLTGAALLLNAPRIEPRRFIPTELASVDSCLTATRAAQPIRRRLDLFGLPPSVANRKNGMVQVEIAEPRRKKPRGKGNQSADLVAIRQHATEASW